MCTGGSHEGGKSRSVRAWELGCEDSVHGSKTDCRQIITGPTSLVPAQGRECGYAFPRHEAPTQGQPAVGAGRGESMRTATWPLVHTRRRPSALADHIART